MWRFGCWWRVTNSKITFKLWYRKRNNLEVRCVWKSLWWVNAWFFQVSLFVQQSTETEWLWESFFEKELDNFYFVSKRFSESYWISWIDRFFETISGYIEFQFSFFYLSYLFSFINLDKEINSCLQKKTSFFIFERSLLLFLLLFFLLF